MVEINQGPSKRLTKIHIASVAIVSLLLVVNSILLSRGVSTHDAHEAQLKVLNELESAVDEALTMHSIGKDRQISNERIINMAGMDLAKNITDSETKQQPSWDSTHHAISLAKEILTATNNGSLVGPRLPGSGNSGRLDSLRQRFHKRLSTAKALIEQESMEGLEYTEFSLQTSSAIIILILLSEFFFNFKLLLRILAGTIEQLTQRTHDLEASSRTIEHTHKLLEASNEKLWEKNEVLEEKIHEQQTSMDLLRIASQRFQQLFHGLPIPCFSVDHEARVFEWNGECEAVFGVMPFIAFEQCVYDFLVAPEYQDQLRGILTSVMDGEQSKGHEMKFIAQDGTLRDVLVGAFPIHGATGTVTGAIIAAVDITERKRVESQIKLFSHVVNSASNGIFIADSNGVLTYVNSASAMLRGRSSEESVGLHFAEFVANGTNGDEAVTRISGNWQNKQSIRERLKVLNQNGDEYWVEFTLHPVFDENLNVTHFAGIESDITEQHRSEVILTEREEMLRVAMNSQIAGLMIVSSEGKVSFANDQANALFERIGFDASRDDFINWSLPIQLNDSTDDHTAEAVCNSIRGGVPVSQIRIPLTTESGDVLWLDWSLAPLRDQGETAMNGSVVSMMDVTDSVLLQTQIEEQYAQLSNMNVLLELQTGELEQANQRLSLIATKDGLTGIDNHRSFREYAEEALKVALAENSPLSLILLDVDHFKKFNDSFGHQAGDEVLRGVANCLVEAASDDILVARYGGEEFVVVLPGCRSEIAQTIAEAMRHNIEFTEWPNRQVTASFGVTTLNSPDATVNSLIEEADQALYAAKHEGRNRTTHYSTLPSSESRAI